MRISNSHLLVVVVNSCYLCSNCHRLDSAFQGHFELAVCIGSLEELIPGHFRYFNNFRWLIEVVQPCLNNSPACCCQYEYEFEEVYCTQRHRCLVNLSETVNGSMLDHSYNYDYAKGPASFQVNRRLHLILLHQMALVDLHYNHSKGASA